MTQQKIFGTDGVRGIANVEPVTAETALKLRKNPRFQKLLDGPPPKIIYE